MTGRALWPFAQQVYRRPGMEAALLELQDRHRQCVPFLLWALWLAAEGRPVDDAALAQGAELARAWQDAAVAPLRGLRRTLKSPPAKGPRQAWESLRDRVKALELDAERMLLEMLEAASPAPDAAPLDALESLRPAVRAWGDGAPPPLLQRLAALVA